MQTLWASDVIFLLMGMLGGRRWRQEGPCRPCRRTWVLYPALGFHQDSQGVRQQIATTLLSLYLCAFKIKLRSKQNFEFWRLGSFEKFHLNLFISSKSHVGNQALSKVISYSRSVLVNFRTGSSVCGIWPSVPLGENLWSNISDFLTWCFLC